MEGLFYSVKTMAGLGGFFSIVLIIANKIFKVEEDPRVKIIEDLLPGINCGACGYAGCRDYAEAIVLKGESVTRCAPGGEEVAEIISKVLGREEKKEERKVVVLLCQGDKDVALDKFEYIGIRDCRAAVLVQGGNKKCSYGCLGLGTCEEVCPFDAIHIGEKGLPVVDEEKCTGCGICVRECPKNVLKLISRSQKIYLACNSHDSGKEVREYCKRGCFTCKICVNPKFVPEGKIVMKNDLPEIQTDKIENYEEIKNAYEKCPSKCYVVRKS